MSTAVAYAIRTELKAAGYNRNKVSVRSRHWGSVCVTIKDLAVDYREVSKIAKAKECVSRCSYSGEILSGGNTFIDVKYDDALDLGDLAAVITDHTPEVGSDAIVSLDLGDIGTADLYRDRGWHDSYVISGEDSEGRHYRDERYTAQGIVIALLQRHGPAVAPALLALSEPAAPTAPAEPAEPAATVIAFPAPTAPPAPSVADLEAAATEAAQATAAAQAALEAAQAAVNAAMIAETDALKALIAARKAG